MYLQQCSQKSGLISVCLLLCFQIYLHLANVRGEMDTGTPDNLDSRIVNLQKALDSLELAIARLSPSEDGVSTIASGLNCIGVVGVFDLCP